MANKVSSYDASNFIINYCIEMNISINNLKLNAMLSYIYYESINQFGDSILNEKPVRNSFFYLIESVYNRFSYMGAEPITCIPGDFDFMTLLDDDFDIESTNRLSKELLYGVESVETLAGSFIKNQIERLKNKSIFDFIDIIDKKNFYKK